MNGRFRSDMVDEMSLNASTAALDDVSQGRIVLVRGALSSLGLMGAFREISLSGIGSLCGGVVASKVDQIGFERMHEVVPISVMAPLVNTLTNWFAAKSRMFMGALLGAGAKMLFAPDRAWPRAMLPYDLVAKEGALDKYLGHLVPHNPHRDSWFSQPLNGINAWTAIGAVSKGNGLLVYPSVFGQALAHDGTEVARTESIGVPVTTSMNPGDMLLFHGDHLHSSALNVTDRTRYVVSFRLTVESPIYPMGQKQTKYWRVDAAAPPRMER